MRIALHTKVLCIACVIFLVPLRTYAVDITEDMVNWDWNFPYKGQNFDRAKKYLSRSKLENYDGSGATDIYIKLANLNNGQKQITILTGDKDDKVTVQHNGNRGGPCVQDTACEAWKGSGHQDKCRLEGAMTLCFCDRIYYRIGAAKELPVGPGAATKYYDDSDEKTNPFLGVLFVRAGVCVPGPCCPIKGTTTTSTTTTPTTTRTTTKTTTTTPTTTRKTTTTSTTTTTTSTTTTTTTTTPTTTMTEKTTTPILALPATAQLPAGSIPTTSADPIGIRGGDGNATGADDKKPEEKDKMALIIGIVAGILGLLLLLGLFLLWYFCKDRTPPRKKRKRRKEKEEQSEASEAETEAQSENSKAVSEVSSAPSAREEQYARQVRRASGSRPPVPADCECNHR